MFSRRRRRPLPRRGPPHARPLPEPARGDRAQNCRRGLRRAGGAVRRCGSRGSGRSPACKIATTTKVMQAADGHRPPLRGTIFASRVHTSPATIAKARLHQRARRVRAGRAARPRPAEGSRSPTRARACAPAVGEVMAAFELIEDRYADYKTTKALSLIADNAWNGGIVIGGGQAVAGRPRPQRHPRRAQAQRQGGRPPARPTIRWARWPGSPTWPSSAAGP